MTRRTAVEELVAEIGGSFLCAEVGVPQSDDLSNQAAYLASWLKVLQADPTAIFTAASQASRGGGLHPVVQPQGRPGGPRGRGGGRRVRVGGPSHERAGKQHGDGPGVA